VFYIVEQESKLESLERLARLGLYVDVISTNDYYHPKLTSTVAVYLRLIGSEFGHIIPIDHEEGLNIPKERVSRILSKASKLYTLDKKKLLYYFNMQGAIDLSLLYSMKKFEKLEYSRENNSINNMYNKHGDIQSINKLIPISKLYESCEKVYDQISKIIEYDIPEGFDFYNSTATNVFFLIEQSGLGIFYDQFNDMFKPRNPLYNTQDNSVLTYYNLYNATSRPTNAFNSVNFAAIPKGNEFRKCFRPTGDYFVELDFDGYHLRLLCEQIDYPLSSESAHKQLAKQYFNKEEITDDEYNKAKQINFHAIYGKIPEKYAFLEVFNKIDGFIKRLWSEYETNGRVLAPISNKPFTKTLKDMHPQKLMNYLMQSLETSRNVLILKDVLGYLKDKKTKLVLYTYDALLFDFYKDDGKETLEELKVILESGGKYPTKFKYSNDLCL
tara:strand:- start:1237 stop:2562 length:1326 start_codon:yes stop_codon:yes gene_type:complete